MKAIVYTKYGSPDVLHLEEVDKPSPRDEEVLVKVHAASSNAGDWHLLTGDPFPAQIFQSLFLGPIMSKPDGRKMTIIYQKANQKDLLVIRDLLQDGKIKPVIDACYPLKETPEAFRYFGKGHTHGKVVITIAA